LIELVDKGAFMGDSTLLIKTEPEAFIANRQLNTKIPQHERFMRYFIKNNTANALIFNLGKSASGTDIINARPIAANEEIDEPVRGSTGLWAAFGEIGLYASSPNWNSANLSIAIGRSELERFPI